MRITYSEIRAQMDGRHYDMSLVGAGGNAVIRAVNQGIDSHLEACFVPDRGDRYERSGHRLDCNVSPESLPVLLRRLSQDEEVGESLAADILGTLGFDVETACWYIVPDTDIS